MSEQVQSHFWCLCRGLWQGCKLTDAPIETCLSYLPSTGTLPANKPCLRGAALCPSSHCSHWADWAVVRQQAGRTGTQGMTRLVQTLTSYCSCLPPSPLLSHKLYLCLTPSTPFFPVFFFLPEISDMHCKMSGIARLCGTSQILQHQVGDSIFLSAVT